MSGKKTPLFFWVMLFAAGFVAVFSGTALATDDTLTSDYFLTDPNYTLDFLYYGEEGDFSKFVVKWEQLTWNTCKKTCEYPNGVQDYFYYLNNNGQILEIKTGWSIPFSEWTDYEIMEGFNIVCKPALAGETWSNEYKTRDVWGNISHEYNTFTFVGLEEVAIMGENLAAAKISWSSGSVAEHTSPEAEWANLDTHSQGEDWYVKGLGLVKRNFLTDENLVRSGFELTGLRENQ